MPCRPDHNKARQRLFSENALRKTDDSRTHSPIYLTKKVETPGRDESWADDSVIGGITKAPRTSQPTPTIPIRFTSSYTYL